MNNLVAIPFYEDTLWADGLDPNHPVAVKPICEALQIDWEGQRQRISRDAILSEGACIIKAPSVGGTQETMCLPLSMIPGFLFGIDDRRIKDEKIKQKVLRYKRECHAALYRHFLGEGTGDNRAQPPTSEQPTLTDLGSLQDVNTKARLVEIAERLSGKTAARALWAELGLPPLMEREEAPNAASNMLDSVALFAREGLEPAPGVLTPAAMLVPAYMQFCALRNIAPYGDASFQTRFGRMGFLRSKSTGRSVYLNIRVKPQSQEATQ